MVGTATYGTSRPEICATYQARANCPNVGFTYQLNTAGLTAGAHTLTVNAGDRSNPPQTGSVTSPFTVSTAPVPDAVIDFPAAGSTVTGILNMFGWAMNNRTSTGNPIGGIQVLVDNAVVGIANYGQTRQDVCNYYPGRGGCPNANVGYQFSLDTSDFLPGSQHTISVAASDTSTPPVTGVFTNAVTAASGQGGSHTFSFSFPDTNPISDAQVVFNFGPALNDACAVHYVPSAQQLYMADKTGSWSYSIPFNPQTGGGSATLGDLVNTNCQIVGSGSTFHTFGSNLILTLQVNFASSFIGPQNIYTQLSDTDGPGAYQLVGAWTAFAAPSVVPPTGVAPSTYDKTNGLLTISLNDVNGYNYMPAAYLEFGPSQTDANTCRVLFQRGTGPGNDTLTLFAGSFDVPGEIGTSAVGSAVRMQSAACLLDVGHSVVSVESGNTATLVLAIQFNNLAIGAGTVYSYVGPVDRTGAGAAVPVNGAGSYANFASGSFFVQPNDFYLSSQSTSLAFQAGSSLGFSVTAAATGIFNLASLSYSCAGSTGINCVAGTSGANFSVNAAAAVAGTATVTAVGGGITHLIAIPVSATTPPPLPTFSVIFPSTSAPYSTISYSQYAFLSLGFTALNNWTSNVLFSVVPNSVTTGFSACIATPTGCAQSLSVSAASPVQLDLYQGGLPLHNPYCATVNATGSQNGNTVTTSGTVCVNVTTESIPPGLQLNTLTSITVPPGGSVTASLNVNTQGSVGPVTVTSSDTQNVSFQGSLSSVVSPTPGGTRITYQTGNYTTTLTGTGASGATTTTVVTVTRGGLGPRLSNEAPPDDTGSGGNGDGVLSVPNDGVRHTFRIKETGPPSLSLYTGCFASGSATVDIAADSPGSYSGVIGVTVLSGSAVGTQTITCHITGYSDSSSNPIISVYEACKNPTVKIRSRPIQIAPSTSIPGTYEAFLTSSVSVTGGVYTWTTNNPSMVGFITQSSGPNATQVKLGIISTNDKATITLTYYLPCGGSVADSFTFALSSPITVLGWIDGSRIIPDANALHQLDPEATIDSDLSDAQTCFTLVAAWSAFGSTSPSPGHATNGYGDAEIRYINQFLLRNSANGQPATTMSSFSSLVSRGDYRLLQQFQTYYEVNSGVIDRTSVMHLLAGARVGGTPEPCSGLQAFSAAGEIHSVDGGIATTTAGDITYQINEGRVGSLGQAGNQYLNGVPGQTPSQSTPWVWSMVQFDSNGKFRILVPSGNTGNISTFPSFWVYSGNSTLSGFSVSEGDLQTFINLTATTSQLQLPQ